MGSFRIQDTSFDKVQAGRNKENSATLMFIFVNSHKFKVSPFDPTGKDQNWRKMRVTWVSKIVDLEINRNASKW